MLSPLSCMSLNSFNVSMRNLNVPLNSVVYVNMIVFLPLHNCTGENARCRIWIEVLNSSFGSN